MSLLTYFFYFLLLLFPLGNLGRIELGRGVNASVNDVTVLGFVLSFFVLKFLKKEKIHFPLATKAITFFAAVAFISLVVGSRGLSSFQIAVSGLYLFRWIIYALLYIIVYNLLHEGKFKTHKIYDSLIFITLIIAILGLIQYAIYPDLGNLSYLGWDPHLHRVFVPFFDPIFTGAILVLGLIVLTWNTFKEKYPTFWHGLMGILIYMAFALTYSRAAYLMAITALTVFSCLKKSPKIFLVGIIIFAGTLLILPERSYGNKLGREETLNARIENWIHAAKVITKNPILGVGFNTYRYTQQKEGYLKSDWEENHAGAGVDNSFLFVLATTGIVGLLAYLNLLFTMGKLGKSSSFFTVSFISLFLYSLATNGLFYTWIMEWIWILLAVSELRIRENR
jgi:O-antigen ligase